MRGAVVGAVVLLLASPAAAQPAPPAVKNAALQYWQAFAELPRFDPQNELPLRVAKEWPTIAFTPDVLGYLSAHQRSLTFLHRGADLVDCVWPSQLNVGRDGLGVLMPQQSARGLAVVAVLRARYRFEQGHPTAALDDLFATLRLARHVGDGGGTINHLIERAVDAVAVQCAAAHVWALGEPEARNFLRRWDALPRPRAWADVLSTDRDQLVEGLETRKSEYASAPATDLLGRRDAQKKSERLGTVAFLAGKQTEAESVRQFVAAVRREYGRAAEIARLPLGEVKAAETVWQEKLQANAAADDRIVWALVAQLPYQVYRQRVTTDRLAATRAMLRAAVAARANSEETPTARDPFGDGPFRHTRTADGYELESALSRAVGEPVVLRVITSRPR